MSPIHVVYWVEFILSGVFTLVIAAMSVWALAVAAQASNYAYQSAGKRTKTFWVAVTAACTVYSLWSVYGLVVFGGGASSWLFQLITATAAGVFLADVRPAVAVRRRR